MLASLHALYESTVHVIRMFTWTGPTDECTESTCSNGGVCVQHWHSFVCDCDQTSFTGPTCDDGQALSRPLFDYFSARKTSHSVPWRRNEKRTNAKMPILESETTELRPCFCVFFLSTNTLLRLRTSGTVWLSLQR